MKRAAPALLALLVVVVLARVGGDAARGRRLLVGAHYYVWYPENFAQGYLRGALRPAQRPFLGEYDSRDPRVAERQIALAASHGIDFFTVDWWPGRPRQNEAIEAGLLGARNLDRLRFCMFYETADLAPPGSQHGIVFDDAVKARFVADLRTIAGRYFDHPRYLRVHGRPVIVLYVTREARGRFPEAMREARAALAGLGHDPFVIGDEIFWAVVAADEDPAAASRVTGDPQRARIRLFDAITAYNLYIADRPRHRGYGAESTFLGDAAKLLRRYRDATEVPIVPGVIPGFNDRGTRPDDDHFAIPRRWSEGGPEGSFLAEAIERIGKPFVDRRVDMLLVTSWNEWNEDTAIEPLVAAAATRDDTSGTRRFTEGYAYEGFGTAYLDVLRDRLRR